MLAGVATLETPMGKRKGIIYEAIERPNIKMAPGTSHIEHKQVQRQSREQVWPFTSGQVHAHGTRHAYQQHILRFIQWTRVTYAIRRLELVVENLTGRLEEGCSSYMSRKNTLPVSLREAGANKWRHSCLACLRGSSMRSHSGVICDTAFQAES
jgi:hypothetical protein